MNQLQSDSRPCLAVQACPLCGTHHSAEQPCSFAPVQSGNHTLTLPSERPAEADDLVGSVVGNFKIVRLLGRGGMGSVYLGEHTLIGSKVAMKFLHPHMAGDAALVQRFFSEARAVNLVGHENIVSVLDLGMLPPNRYYLVMELLEGAPLQALVGSPFTLESAVSVLSQVCDALQAAHDAGVVHRDLKPENVFLIRREGRDDFVKLVDFGIARLSNAQSGVTAAGFVVGTPDYMAPEQWVSSAVDGRADIYALGLIAYLLGTGTLPFTAKNPLELFQAHSQQQPPPLRAINPKLPPAFEAAVLTALAKAPEQRFQQARDFKQALRAALAPSPASTTPLPLAVQARPDTPSLPAPAVRPATPAACSTPGPVAPAPRTPAATAGAPRAASGQEIDLHWSGQWLRGLRAADLSAGGLLVVATPPFPPLRSRVGVRILHAAGALEIDAEVVSHISPEQAKSWNTASGYALQFAKPSTAIRAALAQLLKGELPAVPADPQTDDPAAEPVLEPFRRTDRTDPYAVLGLPPDASCAEARQRARQAGAGLEALAARALSFKQLVEADQALGKLTQAAELLGSPERRAAHDAARGNFRGVARCLGAGLRAGDAEQLRREFLATRPKNETVARLRIAAGRALEGAHDLKRALGEYEAALALDPLNIDAQHAYWNLKRRLGGS